MKRRDFLEHCAAGVPAAIGLGAGTAMVSGADATPSPHVDPARLAKSASDRFLVENRTCCESILMAGCEAIGLKSELVPDIAMGLAGGVGMQGDICGVLTSSALVVSLAVAKKETDYAKKKMRACQAAGQIHREFKKQFGCTDCRSLCGVDLTTAEGRKKLVEGVKAQKCAKFVQVAAQLLARELQTI